MFRIFTSIIILTFNTIIFIWTEKTPNLKLKDVTIDLSVQERFFESSTSFYLTINYSFKEKFKNSSISFSY